MTDKKTEALKLALEALEEIHPGNMTPIAEEAWNKAITTIREALAEQQAQQELTEKELSDGLAMALHDAVLIRLGGNDEATMQACARIDKLVDKYRAEKPEIKPAQQDSTCNKKLREQGKAYPRTCKKCGLGPCIADRVQPAPVAKPHEQQEPMACKTLCELCVKRGYHFCANAAQTTPIPYPPASKPWVGLTDEEVIIMSRYDLEYAALIGEVQRKLKEKNT